MRQYKDSGIEWIGKIPETWEVSQLSILFKEHSCRNIGMQDTNLLSLSYGNIVRKNINDNGGLLPESFEGYNVINKDDIVFRLTDLQNDKRSLRTGLVREKGIITSAYVTVRKRDTKNSSSYFHYLFHSCDECKIFYGLGAGVRQGMNYQDLKKLGIVVPPYSEQQRIADYLDEKCGEIDSLIALQEQMIEKLKAYKQSFITEAVTKGLNPNVKLVPSGIDWIGEIPEGWKVIKTKYIADKIFKGNGITKDEVFVDGDTPCVRYGEIYTKYTQAFKTCFSATNIDIQKSPQLFHYGDILCAGTGELVEEIGKSIVYLGSQECLAGGDIIVIQHHQNPSFLNYALNSNYAQTQKSRGKAKLKVVHISAFEIGSTFILLPPLTEQQTIASYLDEKCADVDRLIALKQQKIDSLKKYKKSVIYEVVTGKTIIE